MELGFARADRYGERQTLERSGYVVVDLQGAVVIMGAFYGLAGGTS
jgi:hypothetical protein